MDETKEMTPEEYVELLTSKNREVISEMLNKMMFIEQEQAERNRQGYERDLLDRFAMTALQGILASSSNFTGGETTEKRCWLAWKYAKEMMAQRK